MSSRRSASPSPRTRAAAAITLVLSCVACAPPTPAPATPNAAAPRRPSPAAPRAATTITFLDDDYPRALAEARATGRPLFVDAWAPWCHTCLSLRAFVFPDPRVVARAKDFVWLAVDVEKEANAAFVRAHPMDALPTLWVIDPKTEAPSLRWNGAATAEELASLLDDARDAIAHGDGGHGGQDGHGGRGEAAAAYLRGNQQAARGESDAAIASYRAALGAAPAGWPKRGRVVEALSARLRAAKQCGAVLDLARGELARIAGGTSAKNVALDALLCLSELPDAARGARAPDALAAAERIARDPSQTTLADDRSELYGELVEQLEALGRKDDARRVAREWSALLDGEAARARTPAERAVFDAHRCQAYIALGEPARAVPVLEASERDFPDDYNPPARLAIAYFVLHDYDRALGAIDRALRKANGPRVLRLYTMKADVLAAKGNKTGERAAIDEALARTRALPLTGSAARARDALEVRRAAR